jgi:hypothetical protein
VAATGDGVLNVRGSVKFLSSVEMGEQTKYDDEDIIELLSRVLSTL